MTLLPILDVVEGARSYVRAHSAPAQQAGIDQLAACYREFLAEHGFEGESFLTGWFYGWLSAESAADMRLPGRDSMIRLLTVIADGAGL